jgi:ABC-type antimicrobial peptide transport system permease subunit
VLRELSHLAAPSSPGPRRSLRIRQTRNVRSARRQPALWLAAGLLAVIGLLVLGQLLARQVFLESSGYSVLRTLGMSRRQMAAAGICRAAMIGAAAGAAGLIIAVVLSAAFPVGLAGTAEPHPGVDADWLVLALGMIGAVTLTIGCTW